MEKSVDAFRTISEVADDLDLPQHVLRFWETRFAQIRPLKRAGGRRYYRPADVVLLRSIRQLLYDEGYTIKGVQRLFREKGTRALREDLPGGGGALDADVSELVGFDAEEGALEPSAATDLAAGAVASEPNGADVLDFDGSALRHALAIIEECERILKAVRGPCS